jgi:hypothetical protein
MPPDLSAPPGGGGGSGTAPETPEQRARRAAAFLADAVNAAVSALKNNGACRGLFGPGLNPHQVLEGLAAGTAFGSISFAELPVGVDAQTKPREETRQVLEDGSVFYGEVDIVITTRDTGTKYWLGQAATVNDRARILIHELGHAFNFLLGTGGSQFEHDMRPDGSPDAEAQKRNAEREKTCMP